MVLTNQLVAPFTQNLPTCNAKKPFQLKTAFAILLSSLIVMRYQTSQSIFFLDFSSTVTLYGEYYHQRENSALALTYNCDTRYKGTTRLCGDKQYTSLIKEMNLRKNQLWMITQLARFNCTESSDPPEQSKFCIGNNT